MGLQYHFRGILTKMTQHKFNHKKVSDKPRVKSIPQNNWTVPFKSVKVTKDETKQTEGQFQTQGN